MSDNSSKENTQVETVEEDYIEKDIQLDELAFSDYTGRRRLKNDRHERFCQEYLKDLNGRQAAIRAGYSEKGAQTQASRMLSNVKVVDRIRYLKRKRQRRTQITADQVLKEISSLAFSDILDYIEIDARGNINFLPEQYMENTAAIQEISVSKGKVVKKSVKLHDKIRALDMLMKHMDLYEPFKLELKKAKLKMEQMKNNPQGAEYEDDGFIEAMQGSAEDIMEEYEQNMEGGNIEAGEEDED